MFLGFFSGLSRRVNVGSVPPSPSMPQSEATLQLLSTDTRRKEDAKMDTKVARIKYLKCWIQYGIID